MQTINDLRDELRRKRRALVTGQIIAVIFYLSVGFALGWAAAKHIHP
jgi:hypothetical protein